MYNFFDLQRQGVAYLCGHLHTLGGLFPRMYARPTQGHLELEAGDWKENRRYQRVYCQCWSSFLLFVNILYCHLITFFIAPLIHASSVSKFIVYLIVQLVRRYRIVAVDHDIFSFVDAQFGALPVILITNPKDARFQASGREAFERTANSTHIR